jgi:hypothetical protein
MRLTKEVLQQRYSQVEEESTNDIVPEIEENKLELSPKNQKMQLSLDLGAGKLIAVFLMGMFMLVGPAILFENREQLVVAVLNSTQTNNSSQIAQSTQVAQPTQVTQPVTPDSGQGRVAGLSDQAGTSSGQTLSVIFFVVGAVLLTIPVFVVLRL